MIRIGVCDDEAADRRYLRALLQKWTQETGEETEVKEYGSGEEFLQGEEADLLFLDIGMEEMDGLSVKEKLNREKSETRIIFTTSHREQIGEAFGKQVFGFLCKPVDYRGLKEKLGQVMEDIEEEYRLLVAGVSGEVCVRAGKIAYIRANGKYSGIRTGGELLFSNRSIGSWKKELEGRGFFHCHRSYLVNLGHIRRVGEEVVLLDGEKIPLSRRLKGALREAHREYIRRRAR